MNSPLYLGVVIHPDREPEKQIEVVSYAESYEVADGQAQRAWEKAYETWRTSGEGAESPIYDVYVCERRMKTETAAYQALKK